MVKQGAINRMACGAAAVLILIVAGLPVAGVSLSEDQRITAGGGGGSDRFGECVAADGSLAVVGAPRRATDLDVGGAYALAHDGAGWMVEQALEAADGTRGLFGDAVAISGDTIVVGAPEHEGLGQSSGAVYVFVRDPGAREGAAWREQAMLQPGGSFDRSGSAVAIDGDTLVIGARTHSAAGNSAGSAFVFVREGETWSQQAQLLASDAAPFDEFGRAVAIDGDTIVVGVQLAETPAESAGAAYVFVREGTTWSQQAKLTPETPERLAFFGSSVDVDGDRALVGAPGENADGRFDAGAAYVFARSQNQWAQEARLIFALQADTFFGEAVALAGDRAVVGGHQFDSQLGGDAGEAYLFERTTARDPEWALTGILRPTVGAREDFFGTAVAFAGDRVLVGAPAHATDLGENAGAIFSFAVPTPKPDDEDNDGFSSEDGDCDDLDPDIFPGAEEVFDGIDNDCDGVVDDGFADLVVTQEADVVSGQAGVSFNVVVTITNQGGDPATGIRLRERFAGVALDGAAPSQGDCRGAGARLNCRLGDLDPGRSMTITLEMIPDDRGRLRMMVAARAAGPLDPDMDNNAHALRLRVAT